VESIFELTNCKGNGGSMGESTKQHRDGECCFSVLEENMVSFERVFCKGMFGKSSFVEFCLIYI
jgi:hypothetical protein